MSKFRTLAGVIVALGVSTAAHAQLNLTAETSAPISVPGNTILGLAEFAADAGIADIQVTPGQTLTNSVLNVAQGSTDIAPAPFALPFLLSRGAGPYAATGEEEGAKLADNLRVLYTYRLAVFGLGSFESSNFGGYGAVEGATVYNGPPRGAALNKARAMIRLATGLEDGKGYEGIQVSWGQAVPTMTDGSADAFLLPMNFPDGRLTQASASGAIVVHSFPKEAFEGEPGTRFGNAPGSAAVTQEITDELLGPKTSVLSEDGMFRGYADVGGEVVNSSMDEETAYRLTKAFLDGLESVRRRAPMMPTVWLGETDVSKTGMCGPGNLRYHAGAVRAWEEAGHSLPDCAKP